jgi:hypothetical protein
MKQVRCALDQVEQTLSDDDSLVDNEVIRDTLQELISVVKAFVNIYEIERVSDERKISPHRGSDSPYDLNYRGK